MAFPIINLDMLSQLRLAVTEFPPPPGRIFSYGTAGFRLEATQLVSTVHRTGVLAALRSLKTKQAIGLMVTASHNPAADNGIKIADPDGGMLTVEWEKYANTLANAGDVDDFLKVVEDIARTEAIHLGKFLGKVLVGRDTRSSGPSLLEACLKGVEAMQGVVAEDKGILTTPQLHWMVRATNKGLIDSELRYFAAMSDAFRLLLNLGPAVVSKPRYLVVDGSNGVGAGKLALLSQSLDSLILEVRNIGLEGEELNHLVGADFVQKEKVPPKSFDALKDIEKRCVSIDGDADRLVYFYFGSHPETEAAIMHLLDGDKIMALFASFIREQLRTLAVVGDFESEQSLDSLVIASYGPVYFGIVQTAYANGASTKYLRTELGLTVALTPTGVKHLHEKALDYDVGIYFEANGHGTILFKESFINWLKENSPSFPAGEGRTAARRLVAMSELMNQAVGDALSGILMVEVILAYRGWSLEQWNSMYVDLPSRQLKVKVTDRSVIRNSADETRVQSIPELQNAIDNAVEMYESGRAFVRPSGTEDIVRVYAEAATQHSADALAQQVSQFVRQLAGEFERLFSTPWLNFEIQSNSREWRLLI